MSGFTALFFGAGQVFYSVAPVLNGSSYVYANPSLGNLGTISPGFNFRDLSIGQISGGDAGVVPPFDFAVVLTGFGADPLVGYLRKVTVQTTAGTTREYTVPGDVSNYIYTPGSPNIATWRFGDGTSKVWSSTATRTVTIS